MAGSYFPRKSFNGAVGVCFIIVDGMGSQPRTFVCVLAERPGRDIRIESPIRGSAIASGRPLSC